MRILPIVAAATIGLFATAAFAQTPPPPNFNGNGASGKTTSDMSGKMGTKKMSKKHMRMMKTKKGMSSGM